MLSCSIGLFKKVERGDSNIYWYRIEDSTGSTILTSYEKISRRKAKITGDVRKTKSGSCYIIFRQLA